MTEAHHQTPALFRNPSTLTSLHQLEAVQAIAGESVRSNARRVIKSWSGYRPTPLHRLSALATELGVGEIWCKDESGRFGLGSFKALGGAFALFCLLRDYVVERTGAEPPTVEDLESRKYSGVTRGFTVACATAGNHGRSVAWGAQRFGCRCVIFVSENVSHFRREAIAQYGAEVIEVQGSYDDSVREAARRSAEGGWTVISDTSYPGYTRIPKLVMQGYTAMVEEAFAQLPPSHTPTHIFAQAGVGGMAATILATAAARFGPDRPTFITVEPTKAACLYSSAIEGRPFTVRGALDTIMGALACGEVSLLAWDILHAGSDWFMVIDDADALRAMKKLAMPSGKDPVIISGESGGAGLAAVLCALRNERWRMQLGLNSVSRILLFGSEGATDPDLYAKIIGSPDV
ncbi:MAG: diaminopropionate ammonia-lyase [Pyrinomonadaceae bacterium]|nr:diaminopropionate ammonia-lyase [Pyrinomonadaceae bacterium]